jgi:hypothetical protein
LSEPEETDTEPTADTETLSPEVIVAAESEETATEAPVTLVAPVEDTAALLDTTLKSPPDTDTAPPSAAVTLTDPPALVPEPEDR